VVTDRLEQMFDRSELRDLGPGEALDAAVLARRTADRAEADLLAIAVHYVDVCPVVDGDRPAGCSDGRPARMTRRSPDRALDESPDRLGGDGTPDVAEFAVEELAAALSIGYNTALHLVSDSVELCYRLPKISALVQAGNLQAWKARQVASETKTLSRAAVAFVDRHLAVVARHNKLPNVRSLVHEALLRCDPDAAAGIEQAALDRRGVWFDHRESTATTQLTATMDTLDAIGLENTVADLATTLGRLGDTSDLDTRRATALGLLAEPQRTLDLFTGTNGTAEPAPPTGGGGSRALLYVHVSAADLVTGRAGVAGTGGGTVEKLGSATLDLVRAWLRRVQEVTVRPVLDMNDSHTVDQHDPSPATREQVMLRDKHCVFPGCTVDARACDLDHIVAYDENGPPGQTSAENLACLCRRHHRAKTFGPAPL
jgi:hypothetical protein